MMILDLYAREMRFTAKLLKYQNTKTTQKITLLFILFYEFENNYEIFTKTLRKKWKLTFKKTYFDPVGAFPFAGCSSFLAGAFPPLKNV